MSVSADQLKDHRDRMQMYNQYLADHDEKIKKSSQMLTDLLSRSMSGANPGVNNLKGTDNVDTTQRRYNPAASPDNPINQGLTPTYSNQSTNLLRPGQSSEGNMLITDEPNYQSSQFKPENSLPDYSKLAMDAHNKSNSNHILNLIAGNINRRMKDSNDTGNWMNNKMYGGYSGL
jgi:hypothetical protein